MLSPLLNIGLLDPRHVVERAVAYAEEHDVDLPSVEGFVRQVIGWREYMRASYVVHGRADAHPQPARARPASSATLVGRQTGSSRSTP